MLSGKTLPCFQPHDVGPRAGGYIQDRFFSGLRPQEYFFHCMAGREGLVDTAVKTSRSGYLQRCLVKTLEALRVHYDHTVRDCDGAVVQFQYGDDAVDVTRGGCLSQFKFLAENPELARANLSDARRAAARFPETKGTLSGDRPENTVATLRSLPSGVFSSNARTHPELPLTATHPVGSTAGVLPEKFVDDLDAFLASTHPDYFAPETSSKTLSAADSKASKKASKKETHESRSRVRSLAYDAGVSKTEFETLMRLRFLDSLAVPGEAVGCVAAQSVGEPSTQMTLNTFHFAGRGEANVTLGIPRLRELLMAASKKLATPVMTLPLRQAHGDDLEAAKSLARRLRRVRLAELVKKLTVEETACGRSHGGAGALARTYVVRVELRAGGDGDLAGDDDEDQDEDRRIGIRLGRERRAARRRRGARFVCADGSRVQAGVRQAAGGRDQARAAPARRGRGPDPRRARGGHPDREPGPGRREGASRRRRVRG
jgi:DNA-directed RNA polymerase I subunit RPA1